MKFVSQDSEAVCVVKPGMRFERNGELYILCRATKDTYALFSLSDGNRWNEPDYLGNVLETLNNGQWKLASES